MTLSALLGRLVATNICASVWIQPSQKDASRARRVLAGKMSSTSTTSVYSAVGRVPRAGRTINRSELRPKSPTHAPLKLLREARHSRAMASTRRLERPSGPLRLHSIQIATCAQPLASPMYVCWQGEDRTLYAARDGRLALNRSSETPTSVAGMSA